MRNQGKGDDGFDDGINSMNELLVTSATVFDGVSPSQRERIGAMTQKGVMPLLGITLRLISPTKVVAALNVQEFHHQPWGILHGGISVTLAETVASLGAWLHCTAEGEGAVGIEINANHLRPVSSGTIIATAEPIHPGRTVQVWGISITAEDSGQLITAARCTLLRRNL